MAKKQGVASATKADLDEAVVLVRNDFKEEIGAVCRDLKEEISLVRHDLKEEVNAIWVEMATKTDLSEFKDEVRSEFKAVRTEMGRGHRTLALQIESQQSEARASEDRLARRMGSLNSTVLGRLDVFTDRMETIWRESKTLPLVVDEQGRTLSNHEARIGSLEQRGL